MEVNDCVTTRGEGRKVCGYMYVCVYVIVDHHHNQHHHYTMMVVRGGVVAAS